MKYFLQGLTMGLAYVAPIGLQNLFVINSALTHTRKRALLTALIVIFFDVTLALACFFGVAAVMQRYEWLQMIILLLGSLIVFASVQFNNRRRSTAAGPRTRSPRPSRPPVWSHGSTRRHSSTER